MRKILILYLQTSCLSVEGTIGDKTDSRYVTVVAV